MTCQTPGTTSATTLVVRHGDVSASRPLTDTTSHHAPGSSTRNTCPQGAPVAPCRQQRSLVNGLYFLAVSWRLA